MYEGITMSDIKLFQINGPEVRELSGQSVAVERSLQTLTERHLEPFFGVRFLASEYSTGKTHGGRIDTLGLDENGCPVIIEYKRALNENVINQGLFYLDWLLDHKGEFTLLVLKQFGQQVADSIEWSSPRMMCIAGDFTRYDEHAVQQINRNIELIRYRRYGDTLLLFELINATTAQPGDTGEAPAEKGPKVYKTVSDYLAQAKDDLRDRFKALEAFLLALGDDVQMKTLKFYFAFKRIKNFACVEIHPQTGTLLAYVKINPDSVPLEDGFLRDVRHIGHFGTGDLEITIDSDEALEKAKPFLVQSYEAS
jgi:predicted transport protein